MEREDIERFEAKSEMTYCPKCKTFLKGRNRLDIFTRGLECAKGHSFVVPIRRVPLAQQGGTMRFGSDDDREVANAWLTKPELRSHLNDQLAQALEAVVVNQSNEGLALPPNHAPFSYCPVCGEELTESGTDGWVKSYLCKRKHKLNERGSRLWTAEEELCSAMSPNFSYQVLESFATRESLKRVVPIQVSELLTHILGARKRHSR